MFIQNILAFLALAIAVLFLFKTFIWWPRKKASNSCDDTNCGCH
ncbi:FeoB-associated Cys-rich membrane protein [Winogradskyella aurantia]|uniref:FeoB-associated Cys-rich membrane protein n=1 Tax=Winogradskyella aurantia TaxID=1915063 RepID=A0A265UZK2_9FLAO|nr:FeoB-associated Cys-rich membrane protein [Winogradskyella aurantia]